MERNIVVPALRHVKLPLDPLVDKPPGVSADRIVEQCFRTCRINARGGLILRRIEHL